MKTIFSVAALAAILALGFAGTAMADSTTAGGVVYTFTDTGTCGASCFQITMTVDTTGATASGTFNSFAVQFTGATSVSLDSVSANAGGLANWSAMIQGNNGGGTCSPSMANFWCSNAVSGIAVSSGGPGDVYTFVFDASGLSSAPTGTHIQTFQGQGALAISNDVGVGTPTPEPASLTLLGLGLLGVPLLRRRK
jgi:hypothetical protein